MLKRRWPVPVLGVLALVWLAEAVSAQQAVRGQYTVLAVGGVTQFDESAALKTDFMRSLYGGLEANYQLRDNVALGGFLLASRPTTDASVFPMNRFQFGDTVIYFLPSQQVTLLEGGVHGVLSVDVGAVRLHGTGGAGYYRVDLDLQRANQPVVPGTEVTSMSGASFVVGGGVSVPLGPTGALRLQARDFIFRGWDREVLSLAEPLLSSEQIPHPNPDPPEAKETIHNVRIEVGFSFRPTGPFGGGS